MGYNMKRGAAPKFKELGSSEAQSGDSPNKNTLQGRYRLFKALL